MPLRVVRRKGSKSLYIRGTVRGQRVNETAGTADRKKAESLSAKREAELYEKSVFGARAVISFQRAVLDFLQWEERSDATVFYAERLAAHFGVKPLAEIDQATADEAVKAIVGIDAAPATKIRGVYTPLCAILNFAAARKWCDAPKFDKPSPPKGKTRWLTPAEATALIAAASPHLKPLLLFILCTGARLAEALDLQWADVDLPAARAIFRDTKSGTDRIASLTPAALVALANIETDEDGKRTGHVFRRDDGEPYVDKGRLEGGQIKTAFRGACRRAGLVRWERGKVEMADGAYTAVRCVPTVTPHDLRHSFATWFYAITKDLLLLKGEGGWATLRMVERYAHLMPSHLVTEIRTIWGETHPRIGVLPGYQPTRDSNATLRA